MENRGVLSFCYCIMLTLRTVHAMHCNEELGGRGKQIDITCSTPDRHSSEVSWLRDDDILDTANGDKYELTSSNTRLTVKNIIGTDEGNYSCKYENSEGGEVTSYAGCLIVFGTASFEEETKKVLVSENGTAAFNLKLSFSSHGSLGFQQEVQDLILKNRSDTISTCQTGNGCSFVDNNRWWSINGDNTSTYTFILHQAVSHDLGVYTAIVELTNPASNVIDKICKIFTLNADNCDKDPPSVEMDIHVCISTLEPTDQDIVGSQANFSCKSGCLLYGSSTLRCRKIADPIIKYEWIDDTGGITSPSCICSGTSVSSTHYMTSPGISISLPHSMTSPDVSASVSDTMVVKAEQTSLNTGAVVGIAVAAVTFLVVVFTITSIIFFSILKAHCSRAFQICDYKSRESNEKAISDCSYAPETVGIHNINDQCQNSTASHKFDSDDNNRDSFIETVILKEDVDSESTTKNSTPTIV